MRLGLYGGTFNPIHHCHLLVAETAQTRLGLDTILFIPTGDPPHKPSSDIMPVLHRMEMVRLAIAPYPAFQVSDLEITKPGLSYTIDTLRALHRSYPADTRFIFIIGLDAFKDIASWKEPHSLLALCEFAVLSRPGSLFTSLRNIAMLGIENSAPLERLDAGHGDAQEIRLASGHSLWGLPMSPCYVSAQEIRTRLKEGHNLGNLLPSCVESYILTHHLGDRGEGWSSPSSKNHG